MGFTMHAIFIAGESTKNQDTYWKNILKIGLIFTPFNIMIFKKK